jgi:hypothetical protein
VRVNIRGAEPAPKTVVIIGKKKPKPTQFSAPFQRLLDQGLEVRRELAKLAGSRGGKLSASAFLCESLKCSKGATVERVKQLRRKLESDSSLSNAQSAMRRMVKELRGPRIQTPPKPDNWPRTERWFFKPRITEVLGELTAAGHSSIELWGVAVLTVAEQFPDLFGTAEGTQEDINAGIAAKRAEYDEICKRIGNDWTASDIDEGKYLPSQGRASPATFRGTDVSVAPRESAGERLLQYMETRRS